MLGLLAGLTLVACSGARPAPPVHTGWSLRYTERAGTGDSPLVVGPTLTLDVVDGRARAAAIARGRSARWSATATAPADRCTEGQCVAAPRLDALCALAGLEALTAPVGAVERSPTVQRDTEEVIVAGVRTEGGRFVTALTGPGTRISIELLVRWIAAPTDPSAAAARAYFLAPLERLGVAGLVTLVSDTVGLPMLWEARVTRHPTDDSEPVVGVTVYRVSELGNPPTRL